MTSRRPRRCVVTGANRGLGFEFARQLVAAGEFVMGTCRNPDSAVELQELLAHDAGFIVPLEVSDRAAATAAATAVAKRLDAAAQREH